MSTVPVLGDVGYIYVRRGPTYDPFGVCKLGATASIPERDATLRTGEPIGGAFHPVFRVELARMLAAERALQGRFAAEHRYDDGGREFYLPTIIDRVEIALREAGFAFDALSREESAALARPWRPRPASAPSTYSILHYFKVQRPEPVPEPLAEPIPEPIPEPTPEPTPAPNAHQQEVLGRADAFFARHAVGKLLWACGLGKALFGAMLAKQMGCRLILVGVPSCFLQTQMRREMARLFPDARAYLYVGGDGEDGTPATTDRAAARAFLAPSAGPPQELDLPYRVLIATYHSCHLLADCGAVFDLKIGDEAHHLVGARGSDSRRAFRAFHAIAARRTLFMTATEKTLEPARGAIDAERPIARHSMDDPAAFGALLDEKSVFWAIENRKITDYRVLTLENSEAQVDAIVRGINARALELNTTCSVEPIDARDKAFFVAAWMSLGAMAKYPGLARMLIYTNSTRDADTVNLYMHQILRSGAAPIAAGDIHAAAVHSRSGLAVAAEMARALARPYSAFACVHMFGEGFDFPALGGVCVAGAMGSEIRIVQALLRPHRLDPARPDKVAYVLIPSVRLGGEREARAFANVKHIVAQLRAVDARVEQKIACLVCAAHTGSISLKKDIEPGAEGDAAAFGFGLGESRAELAKLKIRLRHSRALAFESSAERAELDYARLLNRERGVLSREAYWLCERGDEPHEADPEAYFKRLGVWESWSDFLGIDTAEFVRSKQEWARVCRAAGVACAEDYALLCDARPDMPRNPGDFYTGFSNILDELKFGYRRKQYNR